MAEIVLPLDLRKWTKLSLERYGLKTGRRMGQHFLVDQQVLQDIIETAKLTTEARVLEVGGGLGILTLELLARAGRVVVVELDKKMTQALQNISLGSDKLIIIPGDIIKIPATEFKKALGITGQQDWQIVANLPYEISGAFLYKFLWEDFQPSSMTLLVQREVAERMMAIPGKMSLLSLSCQLKSRIEIVRHVTPKSFWPQPKVQSSLVRMEILSPYELQKSLVGLDINFLWRLARIGFAARRKLLMNNLVSALPIKREDIARALTAAGIKPTARAQELSLDNWKALSQELKYL